MTEYLLAPASLLVGLIVALGLIPLIMWTIHLVRRKEGYLPCLFFASTLVNLAILINAGRDMFTALDTNGLDMAPPPPTTNPLWIVWIARVNMALFSYAVCERLWKRMLHPGNVPNTPYVLIIVFLLFNLTNVFFPSFLGAHPSFEHGYLYLLLAGWASLLFEEGEEEVCIIAVRDTFLIVLLLGFTFIPWQPEFVFSNNYIEGLIPGMTYRYAGLATHPNHLGVYLVLYMLCLWSKPFDSRFLNILGWIAGIVSLILAQSKTTWIATFVCILCLSYFHYGISLQQRLLDFRKPILPALIILSSMLTVSLLLGIVMFSEIGSKMNAFFYTRAGSDLMSMTGRDIIWNIAKNEWRNSPLFGYGLTLWDEAHRARIGMPHATSAHSQFYETLASAGIIGIIGLCIYIPVLFWFALKTARASHGLTLAILLAICIRSMSEVSLPVTKHFGPDGMTHILLLMIIAAKYKSGAAKQVHSMLSLKPKLTF